MSKKIVVLNGGPRANGNTAALIREFVEGAESAGNSVKVFNLQKMNIRGCIGCLAGGKNPDSPCTQKDDMDLIYPDYKDADVVVLASPLYFWGVTGQLKIVIDRLFAVSESNQDWKTPKKECALLMAAGDGTKENWAPMVDYYNSLTGFLEWKDLGSVLAGDVMNIGDIKGKPVLEEARKFGASIGA